MRIARSRLSLGVFLATAAGLAMTAAGAARKAQAGVRPDAPDPADEPVRHLRFEYMERTLQTHPVGPAGPPHEDVGDGAIYYDEIFDESGTTIGTAVGQYIISDRNTANGHLIARYEENVHLPDGKVRTFGTIDRTEVITGGWARFHAVGTSGAYKGFYGLREWQVTDVPTLTARVRMSLCR